MCQVSRGDRSRRPGSKADGRAGGMLRRAMAGALPRRARAPAPREPRAGPRLPLWAGGAPAGRLLGPAARPRWRRGRCRLRVAAVVPGPCARPHTSLHRVASPRWTRLGHLVPGRAVGPACDPAPSRAQCANSRAPRGRGRLQGGPRVPADPGLAPASPWAPGRGQGQEGWRRPAAQCPGDDAALPEAVTSWGLCEGGPGWPRVAPPAPLSLLLPGPGRLHVARAVPTARVSSDSGLPPRSVVRAPGLPGRRLLVPCSQWP